MISSYNNMFVIKKIINSNKLITLIMNIIFIITFSKKKKKKNMEIRKIYIKIIIK
jgi:hypothetical protein